MKKRKAGLVAATIGMVICTVIMAVIFFWSQATNYVSHFLLNWDAEKKEPNAIMYDVPTFSSKEEAYAHSHEVAVSAQAEGTVLLENNGALPLAGEERRISVFGVASVNIAVGGTGSGEGNRGNLVDLYTALLGEGFAVNPSLKAFYEQKYKEGFKRGAGTDMNGAYYGAKGSRNYGYSINEVPRSLYTDAVRASYGEYADAAIVVISRSGGEGQDLPTSMLEFYEADDKHYLELTDEEEEMLAEVKAGGFSKVIVLLNTMNAFECGFLKEEGIDAALWIGGPGRYGLEAVAGILTGRYSPEGRLSDTYAADFLSAPVMQNYGDNRYVDNGEVTTAAYVAYAEGIYMGYRYYETRALYEGEEWYREQMVYPFGYGLSYTEFAWSDFSVVEADGRYFASVTVTNTGSRAGKDVVEIYLTKPYTPGGVEKAAVELVGYAKTKELAPGEAETVTVEVERKWLASYDAVGAKSYVADAGEYVFAACKNAHEKVFTETVVLEHDELFCFSAAGGLIVNQFETEFYDSLPEDLTILSRADFAGTWPTVYGDSGVAGKAYKTMTPEIKAAILSTEVPEEKEEGGLTRSAAVAGESSSGDSIGIAAESSSGDSIGIAAEASGAGGSASGAEETISTGGTINAGGSASGIDSPVTASGAGVNFVDLIDENGEPLPYDDPMWMSLVECMTEDDLYYLVSAGGGRSPAIETINKRQSVTSDSPMGLHVGTLFPCYPIQAATWSTAVAEEIGACVAEEALWNDIRGWYAPACNTHRHPFGGRNYEYYSEDGMLAGKYAAAVVRKAQAGGLFVHLKHFALNDQDTNRGVRGNFQNEDPYNGLCTYADEQTIRELYLRTFQIAVEEGGAHGVMTSYNRIGNVWAGGHKGLLTEVLRNEWGMQGIALTDYAGTFGYKYMDIIQGLKAGNSQWLYVGNAFPVYGDRHSDEVSCLMQKAAKDILYAEATSSRVNNQRYADGTSVIVKERWQNWQWMALAVYLLAVAGYGCYVRKIILDKAAGEP